MSISVEGDGIITVDENSVVSAVNSNGFIGPKYTALINNGTINDGGIFTAVNIDAVYDGFLIENNGLIEGAFSVFAYSSDVDILNYGSMVGDISLRQTTMQLWNYGEIEASISATLEYQAAPLWIENHGVIKSTSSGPVISATASRDTIVNFGEIEGDIHTFGAVDRVVNMDGLLDGNVWLGNGHDIYEAVNGAVTGTVYGEGGNDTLTGGAAHDRLSGGLGMDTITGGDGNDHLMGGRHFDVLTGGEGRDVFEFQRGYGGEQITDFENNFDTLQLDEGIWGGGLTPAQLLEMFASTTGDVTTIDFGGRDVITLEGIDDYRLLANDIVFG